MQIEEHDWYSVGSVVYYVFEEYRDRNGVYETVNNSNAPLTNALSTEATTDQSVSSIRTPKRS